MLNELLMTSGTDLFHLRPTLEDAMGLNGTHASVGVASCLRPILNDIPSSRYTKEGQDYAATQ